MTLGDSWSFAPNDRYKSARQIVHMLVDVVAKGGNYLLNVGPNANGELPAAAVARLAEIGAWMKINGEAIYGTRPAAPYRDGKVCFTRAKGGATYAIYLLDDGEPVPETIWLKGVAPSSGASIRLLGSKEPLRWQQVGAGTRVTVSGSDVSTRRQQQNPYAISLRVA